MKKEIDVFEYASEIIGALKKWCTTYKKIRKQSEFYDDFLGNIWH